MPGIAAKTAAKMGPRSGPPVSPGRGTSGAPPRAGVDPDEVRASMRDEYPEVTIRRPAQRARGTSAETYPDGSVLREPAPGQRRDMGRMSHAELIGTAYR
ncbi:hypothetical protein rosag_03010 [Roseisolibacter agri]|uniref:Uncharacterized protein n=1 Tax=Roseisolibacter agri TaxID=2014610 RepID=A0AA37V8U7_9BACT|nr:hypothetical protein rosag_03010 [Roseisolibacter agri]